MHDERLEAALADMEAACAEYTEARAAMRKADKDGLVGADVVGAFIEARKKFESRSMRVLWVRAALRAKENPAKAVAAAGFGGVSHG